MCLFSCHVFWFPVTCVVSCHVFGFLSCVWLPVTFGFLSCVWFPVMCVVSCQTFGFLLCVWSFSDRSSAAVNLLRALNYDACNARNGLFLRPPSPLVLPPSMADVNHNGPASRPDVNHNSHLMKSQVCAMLLFMLRLLEPNNVDSALNQIMWTVR